MTQETDLQIETSDGFVIHGRAWRPAGQVTDVVVIAGAMGVKQDFYAPFMAGMRQIFARRGFTEREVELWRVFRSRYVSPLHVLHYDQKMLPITLTDGPGGRIQVVNTGRILGGTLNNSQMIEEVEKALPEILHP